MNIEIPTWILCGSHGKFENTHQPVSESKLDSNPNWIYVGPSLLPLLGPLLFLLVLQKFAFGLWDFEQWELEPRFSIRKFSNNPNKIVIFMSQTELEKKKNPMKWVGQDLPGLRAQSLLWGSLQPPRDCPLQIDPWSYQKKLFNTSASVLRETEGRK